MQGTKDLMLTYRRSDSLEIKGYSDADYAGDKDDRKSTIGYVFFVYGYYREFYGVRPFDKVRAHHSFFVYCRLLVFNNISSSNLAI
jgi:hypothetical protein